MKKIEKFEGLNVETKCRVKRAFIHSWGRIIKVGEIFYIAGFKTINITESLLVVLVDDNDKETIEIFEYKFKDYFEFCDDKEKIKQENDKMDIQKGDKVLIKRGIFAESKLTGVVTLVIVEGVDIKLSDGNIISINRDDVEVIARAKNKNVIKKKYKKRFFSNNSEVAVDIRGRRTTVTLDNGVKGSVYCSEDDEYIEENGVVLATKKAISNWMLKEIKEGNVNIN